MIPLVQPDMPDPNRLFQFMGDMFKTRMLTNNYKYVPQFEKDLAWYLGINEWVTCVSSGTVALMMALRHHSRGSYIVTTPFTAPATIQAVRWLGFLPVFADIDPHTWNITYETAKDVVIPIGGYCDVVLPVHLFGNPCDEDDVPYEVKVIYDGAHAFGVEVEGKSVFNYHTCSICSFHSTKTFTTVEGGAIFHYDGSAVYNQMRNFGIDIDDPDRLSGYGINAKMSEGNAIVGILNLENWEENNEKRKVIWEYYRKELENLVTFQQLNPRMTRYNHAYMPVVFKDNPTRDRVYSKLKDKGYDCRKYFIYDYGEMDCPNSTWLKERILCLPLFADLQAMYVDDIIQTVKKEV